MSAYIVSDKHIHALVNYAVRNKVIYYHNMRRVAVTHENAEEIGQILVDENYRSVDERYRERTTNYFGKPETYKHKSTALLDAVTVLKQVNCLAYQSCESDDWETTVAYKILQAIKDEAVTKLPGYDAAPWGI